MKKKGVWLIIIGVIFLSIDIAIPMGKNYPAMVLTDELGGVLQSNVIDHFIGGKPYIDIFNDIIGLVLIFLGSALLVKRSFEFIKAMIIVPFATALFIIIPQLPYNLQAKDLYLKVAGYNFLVSFLVILVEYFLMHGIITITGCIQNKWNSNEMQIGWMIIMINKGLLVGIKFFFGQLSPLYIAYSLIMIGATIFFVNRLLKTLEFDPETES